MLSRRDLLRTGVLAALGVGLAACDRHRLLVGLTPTADATPTFMAPVSSVAAPEPTAAATASPAPTGTLAAQPELHEACFYTQLAGQRVQCLVCFRRCIVPEGARGFCRNKINAGGRYFSLVYGRPSALQIDPIEKEPHYHMWPGATIFCTGTASCNNRCKFCQNWHLSQKSLEEISQVAISPAETVTLAAETGCDAVSFTYNEPTVFYEHMFDVARMARAAGMGTLFHTNGGMNEEPLAALLEHMDAVTVDLKAFTAEFYREVSSSELAPVLRTLQQVYRSSAHLEIVNLMIPTLNDDMGDVRRMCAWIGETLGPDVPLHFTRFFPAYKLTSLPSTPVETLERAAQVADEEGLQYVYVGNVPGHKRNSTFCPGCGEKIIGRVHFAVTSLDVVAGRCRFCGREISGVWADA